MMDQHDIVGNSKAKEKLSMSFTFVTTLPGQYFAEPHFTATTVANHLGYVSASVVQLEAEIRAVSSLQSSISL